MLVQLVANPTQEEIQKAEKLVKAHPIFRQLTETVITPDHVKRKESATFKVSKKRLRQDAHYKCYICGGTTKLEVHHYAAEWSLENIVCFDKLKVFCEEWDVYGYGKLLKNLPITTVDDVRNCMVLCQTHHTGHPKGHAATGIHEMTFSVWVMQKLIKDGAILIPELEPTR